MLSKNQTDQNITKSSVILKIERANTHKFQIDLQDIYTKTKKEGKRRPKINIKIGNNNFLIENTIKMVLINKWPIINKINHHIRIS